MGACVNDMKKLGEMAEAEKTEFAKQFDEALLPIFQYIEAGILEISDWIERGMTEIWNAITPPLDWLFDDKAGAE